MKIILNGHELKPLAKKELAQRIIKHDDWGKYSVSKLCKYYTKEDLREIYRFL